MFINSIPENPDNVYLNISIFNDFRTGTEPILAKYKENRVKSILTNPSEYYLTIVRFSIPTQEIPIFIFAIQEGIDQDKINLSIYSFTMSFGGSDFQTFLDYTPDNFSNNGSPFFPLSPEDNNGEQDISTGYYNVFNYQIMLNMMNTALATCFADLKEAFPAAEITVAPFIIYDAVSQLFSFIVNNEYLVSGVTIFWNSVLNRFLEAIPVNFFGTSTLNGKDFELVVQFNKNNAFNLVIPGVDPPDPDIPQFLELKQEYTVIQYWNSFQKLVIATDLLPVNPEFITSVNESNNFSRILTDFEPIADKSGTSRTIQQFFVSGPYRLIDLLSNSPLQALDIQIFWSDIVGNLFPLFIDSGTSISVKILFIKKELIKGNLLLSS